MKYWLAAILILSPAMSLAAAGDFNFNLNQVPQPVQDLYNTFSKVQLNLGQSQYVNQVGQTIKDTVSQITTNPQNFVSQVKGWWETFNNWLQSHIGVSFKEILTVIGNLFVWVFELMIKLIKLALPNIQNS